MRRFFGSACAAYFDDYCMCEPMGCGSSAKVALRRLHRMLGMPLAVGPKDVPMQFAAAFLGVISDLNQFHTTGTVSIRSKPDRVAKIVVRLEEAVLSGTLPPSDRVAIAGKVAYTTGSAGYNRVGRAAIGILYRSVAGEEIDRDIEECLMFLISILPILPIRRFLMRAKRLRPILVYTDAMYEESSPVPGRIGLVIYDPEAPEAPTYTPPEEACDYRWRHSSIDMSSEDLAICLDCGSSILHS